MMLQSIRLATAASSPSLATPPITGSVPALDPKVGIELVETFTTLCLQQFPESATLDAAVRQRGCSAVPATEVARYLNSDPG